MEQQFDKMIQTGSASETVTREMDGVATEIFSMELQTCSISGSGVEIHIVKVSNVLAFSCICVMCGKGFVSRSSLKQHSRSHSDQPSVIVENLSDPATNVSMLVDKGTTETGEGGTDFSQVSLGGADVNVKAGAGYSDADAEYSNAGAKNDTVTADNTVVESYFNTGADNCNADADNVNVGADHNNTGADSNTLGADNRTAEGDNINFEADNSKVTEDNDNARAPKIRSVEAVHDYNDCTRHDGAGNLEDTGAGNVRGDPNMGAESNMHNGSFDGVRLENLTDHDYFSGKADIKRADNNDCGDQQHSTVSGDETTPDHQRSRQKTTRKSCRGVARATNSKKRELRPRKVKAELSSREFYLGNVSEEDVQKLIKKEERTNKSNRGPLECPLCEKKVIGKQKFSEHMNVHTGNKPYICTVCGHGYSKKSELAVHSRRHTGDLHTCPECGKQFTKKSELKGHSTIHTGERPYLCTTCGKQFRLKEQVAQHMKVHTGEKPHRCNICGKAFSKLSNLKAHGGIHEDKSVICSVCGKKFKYRTSLIRHVRLEHEEKHNTCGLCGQVLRGHSSLKQHYKRKHTKEKPYVCSECGKQFFENSELANHARKHTGEKPFKCTCCGMHFRIRSSLMWHMNKQHKSQTVQQHKEIPIVDV